MCDKSVGTYPSIIKFVPEYYKTQEMCGRVVSEDPFLIVYCPDKCKTQRMCDKTVDDSLATLKLIPDCFICKMIKKLYSALHAEENILSFNEDSGNIVFFVMKWVFLI